MRRALVILIAFLALGIGSIQAQGERRLISLREANENSYKVHSIRFVHVPSKRILNKELRAAMQIREGQPFQRRFFLNDLRTLENFYRSAGYMGMEILAKKLEVDADGKLYVTIKIDSKEQWKVDQVQLELVVSQLCMAVAAVTDTGTVRCWSDVAVFFLSHQSG